jgi:hypothetical protein
MGRKSAKIESVQCGERMHEVRFSDRIVVRVFTDSHGNVDGAAVGFILPAGDPVEAPPEHVEKATRAVRDALGRRAAIRKNLFGGRVMSGRGVDS